MTPPLFEAIRVRVDDAGIPVIDGFSVTTTGKRVLVLGGAHALFEAASGLRPVSHGELRIAGTLAGAALRAGATAGAPLDPPLPPRWTPREYATWSARLAGHARAEARALAANALMRLEMAPVADARLAAAAPHARRATVIAAAIATGAHTLLLEDPTYALPDEVARDFARVVSNAISDRAWVVFAPRLPLLSALASSADEAVLVSGSEVIAQGVPSELAARDRAYALHVHGQTKDFARRAVARGARVVGDGPHMTVDLGADLAVKDLLALAAEASAVILEVRPLARAFA